MPKPIEHPDTKIMQGSPGDPNPSPEPEPGPDPEAVSETPTPKTAADPLVDLRARVERAERAAEEMRRLIPAASPKPIVEEPDIDVLAGVDAEKELFANPKEFLKKFGDNIEKKVEKRLRTEYQRDRGTQDFWAEFYGRHPDLRADSDLVQLVLNSNIRDLANINVSEAYEKLAELTRERILRYAGAAARKPAGKKAQAEAAGRTPATPAAPPKEPEGAEVHSLSDVLRARRRRHRKSQLGAA